MASVGSLLGEYLRARRALIQPDEIGIVSATARRVPGLRRNEVAQLAGISQEYYLRLEQGRDRRPSHQVLTSLARALRLDTIAFEHMIRLSQIDAGESRPHGAGPSEAVDEGLATLVENLAEIPALVMSANQDVLAVNKLALAIRPGLVPGVNFLLRVFSDQARVNVLDWHENARRSLANLRFYGDPLDPRYQEVVGQLSVRDHHFREMWARHDVEQQLTWTSRIPIGEYGVVELVCHSLYVPGSSGRFLMTLTADPGTVAADALRSLSRSVREAEESGSAV